MQQTFQVNPFSSGDYVVINFMNFPSIILMRSYVMHVELNSNMQINRFFPGTIICELEAVCLSPIRCLNFIDSEKCQAFQQGDREKEKCDGRRRP
jgi:hypothetical protein